jgi:hypothetical protein
MPHCKRNATWYGGAQGGFRGADLTVQVFSFYNQTVYFLAAFQHLRANKLMYWAETAVEGVVVVVVVVVMVAVKKIYALRARKVPFRCFAP